MVLLLSQGNSPSARLRFSSLTALYCLDARCSAALISAGTVALRLPAALLHDWSGGFVVMLSRLLSYAVWLSADGVYAFEQEMAFINLFFNKGFQNLLHSLELITVCSYQ